MGFHSLGRGRGANVNHFFQLGVGVQIFSCRHQWIRFVYIIIMKK